MKDPRWQRVRAVFEQAVGKPRGERAAFVEGACVDEAGLAAEVDSLLVADEQGPSWIDEPLVSLAPVLLHDCSDSLLEGGAVGPYRLLRKLGSGGMSSVFLAVRRSGDFEQQVALKVIRQGVEDPAALRRFRLERQILGSLDHPNIARLLDGGSTEEGWPYLVMEHIDGLHIDRYCQRHGLSLHERLELFRTVCQAVHYAHQNLVVHRDLKPANVLVTAEGVPKLLDFGIAKLLNPGLSPQAVDATALSPAPMTLTYASPEQVRGEPITTTSDVYSLGVLLYELVTGRCLYETGGATNRGEIGRQICEVDPATPSQAARREAARTGQEGTRAPRSRELPRLLAGDLDAIVLKALRKEPRQRYNSPAQLEEDLGRHLAHQPIVARGVGLSHRLRKAVRRHKLASAVIVLIVLFGGVMALQAGLLSRALGEAQAERTHALSEGRRAHEVVELLVDLFEESDPGQSRGASISAREVLDRGALRISQLDEDPRTRAALLDTTGRVYQSLGLYDRADALLQEALDIRQGLESTNGGDPDLTASLAHLGQLRLLQGDPEAAETLSRQALDLSRRRHGGSHPEVATGLHNLAESLHGGGRFERAESLYREALELRLELLGPEHRQVAESMAELGLLLYDRRDFAAAEPLLRQALVLWRRLLGPRHPSVASALNYLGLVRRARGDYTESESLLNQALVMRRHLLGDEHPDVATTLSDLGRTFTEKGDLEAAARALEEALALRERHGTKDDPMLATTLSDLATVYQTQGDPAAAEGLFRRVAEIYRRSLGADHPWVAITLTNLARVKRDLGDGAAAEALFRETLAIRRRVGPPGHPSLAYTLYELGRLLNTNGTPEQAEPLLREGLEILRRSSGDGDPWVANLQGELGVSLLGQGQIERAEPLLLGAYAGLEAAGAGFRNRTLRIRRKLADLYRRSDRPVQAQRYE